MDRWLWPAFGGLLLAYGALCRHGGNVRGADGGDFTSLLATPSRAHGTRVVGTGYNVVDVAAGSFVIDDDGFRVRVASETPVRVADVIELSGTFRRDRTVLADRVIVLPHFRLKRGAMLVASLGALAAVVAVVLRRRVTHFSEGLIQERPCPTP